MIDFGAFGPTVNLLVFLAAAAAIAFAGVKLSVIADELADRTGMGEVVAGALFVGVSTSLPGAITSISTAAQGFPELAIGNALGGLTAQTLFIAVADAVYRRANLEHAAATPVALSQGILFIALLTMALFGTVTAGLVTFGLHPVSVLLPVAYVAGLFLLRQIRNEGMWMVKQTDETREEESDASESEDERSDRRLWGLFALYAAITGIAGYGIGQSSIALIGFTGMSQTLFGSTFTAIANSLPELVTAVAAVRIGAVGLAVGDIIGGNAFDVLFLSAADFVSDGSIFQAASSKDQATALIAMLMIALILFGMMKRVKRGIFNIGFESVGVFLLYGVSILVLVL
ncbi:sodium:calcium antiporter [Fulvimarina endophytica]|uniref:Sodium:calcium antiporter n=1 Tax=Fulvimarina endophytica TaxID=2293836 RepID=A0A371WZC4_9HYPH|nr:sodium:calcium antiporter [Fulvimarina endophytica]RFC62124.1 sodium:calcium antiporter [Fulvimarina endophytica]